MSNFCNPIAKCDRCKVAKIGITVTSTAGWMGDFNPIVKLDTDRMVGFRVEECKQLSGLLPLRYPLKTVIFERGGGDIELHFTVNDRRSEFAQNRSWGKTTKGNIRVEPCGVRILNEEEVDTTRSYGEEFSLRISSAGIKEPAHIDFRVNDFDSRRRIPNTLVGRVMIEKPLSAGYYYSEEGYFLEKIGDSEYVFAVANGAYSRTDNGYNISTAGVSQMIDNLGGEMLHYQFEDLAGTLFAEASRGGPWEESAAIYSVLENRGNANGTTAHAEAQCRRGGVAGWETRNRIRDRRAAVSDVRNAYKGLIRGILDDKDYSNGAFFWHGVDFSISTWRANREFYQVGFKFTDPSHDIWNQGNRKSGNSSWDYKYQSTNALGQTIFMKLTPAWQRATRGMRWDGRAR